MRHLNCDFLIIGGGVAGLRAAIELAPHGRVIVVTKDIPTECGTQYAQGGVAVALSDEDEVGIHFEDTIKAGDGLCNEEAVRVLVEEGPERILELIEWGAEFDREGTKLSFTREAAHSRRRILHAHGDSTGKELERALISKVKTLTGAQRFPFSMAVDLMIDDGRCRGAQVLMDMEVVTIGARATILATGGAGQVYSRTTNPSVATGDGMAIAYRAGAVLEDMEFVQFHPTVLYSPSAPQFLLSEAMRGEGAVLRNIHREAFMKSYHPDAELAPRDIVSRAIISQLVRTQSGYVYLDLTHLKADFIKKRFPMIYATCLQYDIDITRDMIPVSPAAHYFMGGIKTDINGATSVPGLYAAGEAACTGVHGANRLASNSLLEGLVYGYRAARDALASTPGGIVVTDPSFDTEEREDIRPPAAEEASHVDEIRTALRRIAWEKAGIIRCAESLNEGLDQLIALESDMDGAVKTRRWLEVKNMLTVALMVTRAALERNNSVGAQYRSDFPARGDGWMSHYEIVSGERGMTVYPS